MTGYRYGTAKFERAKRERLHLGIFGTIIAPVTFGLSLLLWIPYAKFRSVEKQLQEAEQARKREAAQTQAFRRLR